jgi:ubiquinone/menaquinone biosynthesis C-methylase UbiE
MGQDAKADIMKADIMKPVMLNLGCGLRKFDGWVNVDGYGDPDIIFDLNDSPWPWESQTIDHIYANHVFEHLEVPIDALKECARILKPGGTLQVNVPDHTSTLSQGYIDHKHIFSLYSFHMIIPSQNRGTNAWAREQIVIPLKMIKYVRIPYQRFNKWWIPKLLLRWCCEHMVNFCHEQQFTFVKVESVKETIENKPDREVL